jgi:hypothetical protein
MNAEREADDAPAPSIHLSSPFTLVNRTLWFGKIALYEDQIVLSGWSWTGYVKTTIPFDRIHFVAKWTVQEGPNVEIHRKGDAPILGRIEKGAGLWEQELRKEGRIELKLRH